MRHGVSSHSRRLSPYEVPIHREGVALGFDSMDSLKAQLLKLLDDQPQLDSLRRQAHLYVRSKRLELPNAERRLQWYSALDITPATKTREVFNKLWQTMDSDLMDRFADDRYRRPELVDQDHRLIWMPFSSHNVTSLMNSKHLKLMDTPDWLGDGDGGS